MVHAGVVPQWSVERTLALAAEVERALQSDPRALFEHMYGDEPERWSEQLSGMPRLRFTINVLTRMRVCTAEGRVDLQMQRQTAACNIRAVALVRLRDRAPRRITGSSSGTGPRLDFVRREDVVGLDSGCVWGGALTAFDLDRERPPISLPCQGYQLPGE